MIIVIANIALAITMCLKTLSYCAYFTNDNFEISKLNYLLKFTKHYLTVKQNFKPMFICLQISYSVQSPWFITCFQ